jgi:purine-binding chemotaxis protein CheW
VLEVLLFSSGGVLYLSRLEQLDEVLMPVQLEPVPGAPAFLRGVMNLRGRMLPVISMVERFGLMREVGAQAVGAQETGARQAGWTRRSRILKLSSGDYSYGVIVDAVEGIRQLEADAAQAPVLAEREELRFLGALWRLDGRLVQEVRLNALLEPSELERLQRQQPRLPQ